MIESLFSHFPRFSFPWTLLLLALVPWSLWVGSRIRFLSSGRKWTALVLRCLILICLIAALAGAELVKQTDRLAVFFLLDQSSSIPVELRQAGAQMIRNLAAQYQKGKDEVGVIVFGEQPSVERSIGPRLDLGEIRSFVGGEQTGLAAAMRLATAAFPQGYMRRMVIISDGNETQGSALEEARMAQAAGIGVDIVPLAVGGTREVRIREVTAPNRVGTSEPFRLRVVVQAEQECEGTLKIYQRIQSGKRMFPPRTVTLHKGDNVFLLSQELLTPGFYEYEVTIESSADTITANNEGHAFTMVRGEPKVLVVEGGAVAGMYLKQALEAEGVQVETQSPAGMPASLSAMQNYDALVLSNVSATDLSSEQIKNLEVAVRDLGIGLVMIGGPQAFGAGGFLDTPVEAALPVHMDIKQRKILPRGALVLIMHTCEIEDGNIWAREIGLASLNVLASQDLMGALGYLMGPIRGPAGSGVASLESPVAQDWMGLLGFMTAQARGQSGDGWIFKLQPVGDKTAMRRMLTEAAPLLGDMPSVVPTLEMAYQALRRADAAVKRVVVISDGDPAAPGSELLASLQSAGISVSTVCIAPHSPNDQEMLRSIAERTGGQYYYVTNPGNLPQIFTKEAAVVKRGILIEEPFVPQVNHDSELLKGLTQTPLPSLRGYVVTTPKDKAVVPLISHEDDPVLAHWRYGLGKSVAFTSDISNRWAASWLGWEGFNRFWAQTVRWAMRETTSTAFRIDTGIKDGKGFVRVDAVDKQGRFVNFLRPRAVVAGPPPDFARHEPELIQNGPGIYEANFPVNHRGAYLITIVYSNEDGTQTMIPAGLSLGYSREYDHNTTNLPLLESIASTTGGKVLDVSDNPFRHDLKASSTVTPVWSYLALLAMLLFPVEIFVRRVVVNFSGAYGALAAFLKKIPGVGRIVRVPAPRARPATGRYGAVSGSFGEEEEERIYHRDTEGTEGEGEKKTTGPIVSDADYTKRLLDAKKRARGKRGH